jgi:hypothetical protein
MCPNIITFSGSVDGTLVATNAPGTGSVAQTGMWSGIGIQRDAASSTWFLCTTGTASAIVVGFIDPPGTVNGRVRIRMLQASTLLI